MCIYGNRLVSYFSHLGAHTLLHFIPLCCSRSYRRVEWMASERTNERAEMILRIYIAYVRNRFIGQMGTCLLEVRTERRFSFRSER